MTPKRLAPKDDNRIKVAVQTDDPEKIIEADLVAMRLLNVCKLLRSQRKPGEPKILIELESFGIVSADYQFTLRTYEATKPKRKAVKK